MIETVFLAYRYTHVVLGGSMEVLGVFRDQKDAEKRARDYKKQPGTDRVGVLEKILE